jgi:hypothetical protein
MKLKIVPALCGQALVLALASGLCDAGPALLARPYGNSLIPAAFAEDAKKELPPCLAEIAKTTVIEDGRLRSAKLRESLMAAQKLGPGAKDMLVEMAQTATPAGRLLSLALLRKIDSALYQKLADGLKQELGDQSVSYISPSERCHYSVADILNDMAGKNPLIKLLPEAAAK